MMEFIFGMIVGGVVVGIIAFIIIWVGLTQMFSGWQ